MKVNNADYSHANGTPFCLYRCHIRWWHHHPMIYRTGDGISSHSPWVEVGLACMSPPSVSPNYRQIHCLLVWGVNWCLSHCTIKLQQRLRNFHGQFKIIVIEKNRTTVVARTPTNDRSKSTLLELNLLPSLAASTALFETSAMKQRCPFWSAHFELGLRMRIHIWNGLGRHT